MSDDRFQFLPDSRPHEDELHDESWTWVSGGGLEAPIYIRIGWTIDDKPAVTGLMIGMNGDREITATSLRSIRIGAMLQQLFEGWSLDGPPSADDFAEMIEWGLVQQTYVFGGPRLSDRSKAERSTENDTLAAFAQRYREETVRNPRRAMTATAEALHISRATANRWAAQAREKGLLPPRGGEVSGEGA